MSAFAIISGVVFKAPEQRTSKNGNAYVLATIRESSGEQTRWWKALCFNDAAVALLRLDDGDAIAVAGSLDVSTYEKNGETRVNLAIMCDRVLTLKPPKKEKPDRQVTKPAARAEVEHTLNDALPF